MSLSQYDDWVHAGRNFPGLQRLISAALADQTFAHTILTNPARAVDNLPIGITLTSRERNLVLQVGGTTSIANFAAYLHMLMQDEVLG